MKLLYKSVQRANEALEIEQYKTYTDFELQRKVKDEEEIIIEKPEEEKQLEDSLVQAESIINMARQEAAAIQQQAQEEGYAKGEQAGYEDGFRQATQENQKRYEKEAIRLQEEIASYIQEVEIEKEKVLEQYLDDLKNISLAIGEKIVQISLKSSGDIIERMILSATERLKKCAWAKIYIGQNGQKTDVHGDGQFLQELTKLSDNVKVVLMEDADPGTCIVELPDEVIDISVGTQLENIKEILNNARV